MANHDSSVYYHNNDPADPYIEDHQRTSSDDDWWPCYSCGCTDTLTTGCRCSCHSQRRHH